MPATTPEAKARREANRKARLAADPKLARKRKLQVKAAHAKEKGSLARKARDKARNDARSERRRSRPPAAFDGCDGEGYTKDGNHIFALFRMGERELWNMGERLTTGQLLDFICNHPPRRKLAGFAFEYDVTCILRDTTKAQRDRMISAYKQPVPGALDPWAGAKFFRPTWIDTAAGRFGVDWLPRHWIKVCRADPKRPTRALKGSTRSIFDAFGFFQTSFLETLKQWGIGESDHAMIKEMKDNRSGFDVITPKIRAYNDAECLALSELMTQFRDLCRAANVEIRDYYGAGAVASFLHKANGTIRAAELVKVTPAGFMTMAHAAYYGGRFEVTRAGLICEEVFEHDLNSAYPAMMRRLPCLKHGAWEETHGAALATLPDEAIFVCPVAFTHPKTQFLCGFPFREEKKGSLSWPRMGQGIYWSHEIRSAIRLGATVRLGKGWRYAARCTCEPFAWIEERYRWRKAQKGMRGYPIKLGLNALYGKLAQRIGEPPYANPIWAGLITAMTRAALNDAIRLAGQRNVAMIATDGIYTVKQPINQSLSQDGRGRPFVVGEGLGQWGKDKFPSLFIVKPGVYWLPPSTSSGQAKIKSRGVSTSILSDAKPLFEAAWRDYAERSRRPPPEIADDLLDRPDVLFNIMAGAARTPPSVEIPHVPQFVGLRIAQHWGKPELAGQWLNEPRSLSFDWKEKRSRYGATWEGETLVLEPLAGDPNMQSLCYTKGPIPTATDWEIERMAFEAMPEGDEMDLNLDD